MIAPLFALAGAAVPVLASAVTPCTVPAIAYPPGQPPPVVANALRKCARSQQTTMAVLAALGLVAAAASTNTTVRSAGLGAAASAAILLARATAQVQSLSGPALVPEPPPPPRGN